MSSREVALVAPQQGSSARVAGGGSMATSTSSGQSWAARAGVGVWVGLGLGAIGFGLIAWTWGKVAGLVDVYLQLPYFVSGGLGGLGLILVGLLTINLSVKRREALDRQRQLDELREAVLLLREEVAQLPEDEA